MTTTDQFLTKLVTSTTPVLEEIISKRDSRVLRSLATAVSGPAFITENQSRLLLKIFHENSKKLDFLGEDFLAELKNPVWSKPFRPVDKTKKLYIAKNSVDDNVIVIEFAFSSAIRKIIANLGKSTDGVIASITNRIHHCDLTEKNIALLVSTLEPEGFEIEENLKNFYETIKSWSKDEVKNQFLLTNITHQNFQKHITADLGIETAIDENIIADRSMRYQYFTEKSGKKSENLTEIIAHRTDARVWVDNKKYSIEDIINSLVALKRFPMMLVFDGYMTSGQAEKLEEIAKILDKHGIYDNVGMYFRLASNESGKPFNDLIAKRKYNCQLDKDTKVVGVQSGKIPKFFLTNEWKPMSVVALDITLRHSKTAVYANCCDLIISHTETNSIIHETKNTWQ